MVVTDPAFNDIVREFYHDKARQLADDGLLSNDFWQKNKDLVFSVCDNGAMYDSFLVHGKGVVFDAQMVGFLYAQSRALVAGRYISAEFPFAVHAKLVTAFVRQAPGLDAGPLAIIEQTLLERGASEAFVTGMTADPDFIRRERTLFAQAMYFLVMHERCHVALDHRARRGRIKQLDDAARTTAEQQMEFEADRCALDIINADESRYDNSPIAYFGVLMTVATQSIVANHPELPAQTSHPSPGARISAATDSVLAYIAGQDSDIAPYYDATVRGTADYFLGLLAELRAHD
ncbi:MAG: hypothetical protein F4Y02_13225 [Chloroflexi bacterium]|nr:hypothetical protein [Chloroflexota bacterium]